VTLSPVEVPLTGSDAEYYYHSKREDWLAAETKLRDVISLCSEETFAPERATSKIGRTENLSIVWRSIVWRSNRNGLKPSKPRRSLKRGSIMS
jgi:hypothetical protein